MATPSLAEKNKALVERWFETVVNGRNLNAMGDFLAPHFHGGPSSTQDAAGFRAFAEEIFKGFPQMHLTLSSVVAQGNEVMVHWTSTAVHSGAFLGQAASNNAVRLSALDVFTVQSNKITAMACRTQLGLVMGDIGAGVGSPLANALGFGGITQAATAPPHSAPAAVPAPDVPVGAGAG